MSHYAYGQWERGIGAPYAPPIGKLSPHEKCFILRRRAVMTQRLVAECIGRCPRWVNLMERGKVPCDELLNYWEKGVVRG